MLVNYDSLVNEMEVMQGVFVKGSSGAKNIYFHDGKLIAFSPLIMCKTAIEYSDEFINCCLSFDALNKVISGYSTLFYTKVSGVLFEQVGNAIKLTIHEEPKEEGYSSYAKVSTFFLDNIPTAQNALDNFNKEVPEDSEMVSGEEMEKYTKTLFPLLSNDASGGAGKLSFADDYVFFLSNTFSSFVKNDLPDSLKNLEISQSGLSLIRKFFDRYESLQFGKDEGYLVVSSIDESLICNIRVNKLTFKHDKFVSGLCKDKGFVVNRRYFREVLNRLSNFSEQVTVKCGNGEIFVDAKTFNQDVPLVAERGDINELGFVANTNIFGKIILGSDDLMSEDAYVYLIDKGRNISVYITDSSGEWFSVTTIMKA